jgi:hypothetical protein
MESNCSCTTFATAGVGSSNEPVAATPLQLTIEGSAPASGAQQEGEEPADTDTV